MLHAVVMAGGTGTRFWPRSTEARPKQFLKLFDDKTMLQTTVNRVEKLVPAERVWVITNDRYVNIVQDQLPDVPESNIVGEPVAKNTAPCVALAAALIREKDPDGTMIVLPADHHIKDPDTFIEILETASAKAQDEVLVTIGIKPDRPETGYGYIEFDNDTSETHEGREVKQVKQFREKPDNRTAQHFIDSGNFLWNSGMFIWRADTILQQFADHLPEVQEQLDELTPEIGKNTQLKAVNSFYRGCPSISIDYGIMEKADTVFVVPGEFGWNDVGSWRAVYDLRTKDDDGNVLQTDHVTLTGSKNNLVQSDSGKMIALSGVENMAIVETDDAILICKLDKAQGVKDIVNQLREKDELKKFL